MKQTSSYFKDFFSKIYFSSEDFSQISNYFKKMNSIITTEPLRSIIYILQCRIRGLTSLPIYLMNHYFIF